MNTTGNIFDDIARFLDALSSNTTDLMVAIIAIVAVIVGASCLIQGIVALMKADYKKCAGFIVGSILCFVLSGFAANGVFQDVAQMIVNDSGVEVQQNNGSSDFQGNGNNGGNSNNGGNGDNSSNGGNGNQGSQPSGTQSDATDNGGQQNSQSNNTSSGSGSVDIGGSAVDSGTNGAETVTVDNGSSRWNEEGARD